MIEDDEALSSFDKHESQRCEGFSQGCTFCVAERMRCRICSTLSEGQRYCPRCADKVDQIIAERLYEYAANR